MKVKIFISFSSAMDTNDRDRDQDRDRDREDRRKSSNNKLSSSPSKKTDVAKYSPAEVKKILGTPNTTQKLQERLKLLKPSSHSASKSPIKSTISTEADLDNAKNVSVLIEFIKEKRPNMRGLLGYRKEELLKLAKDILKYKDDQEPDLVMDWKSFEEIETRRTLFDNPDLEWLDYTKMSKNEIPKAFGQYVIAKFLTETFVAAFQGQDAVDTGIAKAANKGSLMYKSKKVQMVEFCISDVDELVMFRSHVMASYKNEIRYVHTYVQSELLF